MDHLCLQNGQSCLQIAFETWGEYYASGDEEMHYASGDEEMHFPDHSVAKFLCQLGGKKLLMLTGTVSDVDLQAPLDINT